MADHPTECPVCNGVSFTAQKQQRNYQHETRVHSTSVESCHVSTTFYVRCNQCGNQWIYTAAANQTESGRPFAR